MGKDKSDDKWTRFRVEIDKRYKSPSRGNLKFRQGQSTYLWVKSKHLRCRCPKIRPNASYLILDVVDDEDDEDNNNEDEDEDEDSDDVDDVDTYDSYDTYDYEEKRGKRRSAVPTTTPAPRRTGLTIKKKTLVMEWKKEWRRRMKRFKRRSRKFCPK